MNEIISFDWKEFSNAAFKEFKTYLQKYGVHLYDLDVETHKEPQYSSDWILLLSDKPMSTIEMKEIWKEMFD